MQPNFPAYRGEVERARVLVGLLALAGLPACTTAGPSAEPGPSAVSSPATVPSAGIPTAPRSPRARASEPLVIAVHASRTPPVLDLAAARALAARHRTADPAQALRRAETDPRAIAVVPASAIGPTVRVATVAGVHPLRDPLATR